MGHGIKPPEYISNEVDCLYWEDDIDKTQIGFGHPKFCIKGCEILIENQIEKCIKLRAVDTIGNISMFYDLLDNNDLVLTEQTCLQRKMIGDLLMFGSTSSLLELWSASAWDYSKSGLYNLFDNATILASQKNMRIEEFLKTFSIFVSPHDIKWYTYDNNWDSQNSCPRTMFDTCHLWGASAGYQYYGGFR